MADTVQARSRDEHRLKANVIGPWGLAALAIGITSPAMGLYALWGPMEAAAGPIAPLIFLFSLVAVLPTAISYASLNRHVPSAGSVATWLWITVGPGVGYFAGLVMATYFVMTSIAQPLLFGLFFRDFLNLAHVGPFGSIELDAGMLCAILLGAVVCLRGAEASIKTTIRLMLAETAVVMALSITILWVKAGQPGGINLGPFNPFHATNGVAGIWTAMILGVMAFCGFDVVSTAAEESLAPRHHVPRAIMLTIVTMGLFWAINVWALTLSTPYDRVVEFSTQGLTAITPVAEAYWGIGRFLVIVTAFTGLTAVYISCVQGSSRIIFALARHRLLSKSLAGLEGQKRIPRNAILFVLLTNFVLDFASLHIFQNGLDAFVWWSNALVFFAVLTFAGVNLANTLYFLRVTPRRFRLVQNLVVPMLGLAINVYLIYAAFFKALWSGPFLTGKSVVIGCVVLLALLAATVCFVKVRYGHLLSRDEPLAADTGR